MGQWDGQSPVLPKPHSSVHTPLSISISASAEIYFSAAAAGFSRALEASRTLQNPREGIYPHLPPTTPRISRSFYSSASSSSSERVWVGLREASRSINRNPFFLLLGFQMFLGETKIRT